MPGHSTQVDHHEFSVFECMKILQNYAEVSLPLSYTQNHVDFKAATTCALEKLWKMVQNVVLQHKTGNFQRAGIIGAVASLLTPCEEDKNISSIFPHFPVVSLIFPQIFSVFFLILVLPIREGPGYLKMQILQLF